MDVDIPVPLATALPATRGYQQEMLEESLKRNIIIALDTGSGKTHIAVLRLKIEAERELEKVSWFLAPTVALCEQQHEVISSSLPVTVGLITGANAPDQWKDPLLWQRVLSTHRIMVTTPQILLDALTHGYLDLGRDVGLLVFDEAHNAKGRHPYNLIMRGFYNALPPRNTEARPSGCNYFRPMVLGLTASPVFGGNVQKSFSAIETSLDSVIRTPLRNREELTTFVHKPIEKHVMYHGHPPGSFHTLSQNLSSLVSMLKTIDITDDPQVHALRSQLTTLPDGVEKRRVDQELSNMLLLKDSNTQKALRYLERAAGEICDDLGPWAADWFLQKVIQQALASANSHRNSMSLWEDKEKTYLLDALSRVAVTPVSYIPDHIVAGVSAKTQALIDCLTTEKSATESQDASYSGLIFVDRRDSVIALTEILSHHPQTAGAFRVGCLVGSNSPRQSVLDITRTLLPQSQKDTLLAFRAGDKNLIVSTAVAEEGIDIQGCGSAIRWNLPTSMTRWVQSRGRARRKGSSFILMFEHGGVREKEIEQWERMEQEMTQMCNEADRQPVTSTIEYDLDDDNLVFYSKSTGARITLHSAIPHLNHFCSVLPQTLPNETRPIYDIDPPNLPEGLHSQDHRSVCLPLYQGPYGATVTLPKQVPPELRVFSTERIYRSKQSARRHVAFEAYVALYNAKLLNEYLLPLTSVVEPDLEDEVKKLLKDVEKRNATTSVSCQMDPWIPAPTDPAIWWQTRIMVDDLPPLDMFTRVPVRTLSDSDHGSLFTSDQNSRQRIRVQCMGSHVLDNSRLQAARHYTRRLLWGVYGPKMSWDDLDFVHLFMAVESDEVWEDRREWAEVQWYLRDEASRPHLSLRADAISFGYDFDYPQDLGIVRDLRTSLSPYQFVRWRFEMLSREEEAELRERYAVYEEEVTVIYPLLVVRAIPRRRQFLIPVGDDTAKNEYDEQLFLPQFSVIDMADPAEMQYAIFLPSILRFLSMVVTASSFSQTLLSGSELEDIPLHLLTTALRAPVAQEITNYQRLETFGDTVLKTITSIQLLAEYPLWHEGYLTSRKNHLVSNSQLAKCAIRRGLHRWIIRDRLLIKKWKPRVSASGPLEVADADLSMEQMGNKSQEDQMLSTKVLADVVESLIGAAYLQGGFELAVQCAQLFGLGFTWQPHCVRIERLLRIDQLDVSPTHLDDVEQMLGYHFRNKLLLVEALTHVSHQSPLCTVSYERMEFLGDSVLEMIVTDRLYHAANNYNPGQMQSRRMTIVNLHFLAFICLNCSISRETTMPRLDSELANVTLQTEIKKLYLWQYLLHSSSQVLEQQSEAFARYKDGQSEIQYALHHGHIFPWAALTSLQAPKFFSDIVESLLGAVYIDSRGDIEAATEVLKKLGVLPILERILVDDVDVEHPVSRVMKWASRHNKQIKFETPLDDSQVRCTVSLDGEELVCVSVPDRGRASRDNVKLMAAEQATSIINRIYASQ